MSTLPPVADPTASLPPPAVTSTAAPAVAISTLAPSTVVSTASSARAPILAAAGRPTTMIGTQSSATTTTTTTTKSSKSKKKSSNSASVTMATASTASSSGGSGGGSNGENTGRWTAEEHNLFLQGLELHGKGWKKIAGLIKSRTVVQIRTHAQKYFQKLAKAKQNGEDVTMAGGSGSNGGAVAGTTMTMMMGDGGRSALNGGPGVNGAGSALSSVSASGVGHATAHASKRRKQTTGTKRKAIQSVVASARRQGNKKVAVTSTARKTSPQQHEQPTSVTGMGINSVAPALAPYVLPTPLSQMTAQPLPTSAAPTAQGGTISAAALEDSIFRYLSPTSVVQPETQVNPVARQAGANPITLPPDHLSATNTLAGGEVSPTGVNELELYPTWTDYCKEAPTWYQKGSDVDALLDVADPLDWLVDNGDLNETYEAAERMNVVTSHPVPQTSAYQEVETQPPKDPVPTASGSFYASANTMATMSMNTLPRIDSGPEVNIPPLPPLFDGVTDAGHDPAGGKSKLSLHMTSVPSVPILEQHIFSPSEDLDFVSTILDESGTGSSVSLSGLGHAP